MGLANKDDVFSQPDADSYRDVTVGSLTIRIKEMDSDERDEWERQWNERIKNQKGGVQGFRAFLVAWTAVDEDGKRLFNTNGDVKKLGKKRVDFLNPLATAALEVNRLTDSDVDELAGNSSDAPPDSSPSN